MGTIEKLSHEFWPTAVVMPTMSAGATDGSYLRNAGIPTYGHSGLAGDINDCRPRQGRASPDKVVLRRQRISLSTGQDAVRWCVLMQSRSKTRVAVAGLGSIGAEVARELDRGIEGLVLTAVASQNPDKHRAWLAELRAPPQVLPIEQLTDAADIIVECAPSKLVRSIVAPVVSRGKTAIVLSVGALLENEDLIGLAKDNGGQIIVPTGALIGLDAVTAAAVGTIHSVRLVTRKPIVGLVGAPHLVENKIDIEGITEPLKNIRRHGAPGRQGFSRQSECRCRAFAGRHRSRQDAGRDLGRSDGHAQHAQHRGRFRFSALFDGNRKYSVGKSADGTDHRAFGDRLPAQAACFVAHRDLNVRPTCRSNRMTCC